MRRSRAGGTPAGPAWLRGLDPDERGRIERAVDRIEERLHEAEMGLHTIGTPASDAMLELAALPPGAAMLWARWDGMELWTGEATVLALSALEEATSEAAAEGIVKPGDRVVGERGRDLVVLPEDPWAEGADVVLVDEDAERHPEASTLAHFVLGVLGEGTILFDEHGEFRDGVFDEHGGLEPAVERRMLRRRLDLDPDAPRARLRLAQLLGAAQEWTAARAELQGVLKRAPEYGWAHFELGRTLGALGDARGAVRAFEAAASHADDDAAQAHMLAWAARYADEPSRERLAARVRALRPEYALHQVRGAKARLERNDVDGARELVELGLAVAPQQLELLELRRRGS